jgi:hypothetical protein
MGWAGEGARGEEATEYDDRPAPMRPPSIWAWVLAEKPSPEPSSSLAPGTFSSVALSCAPRRCVSTR